MKNFTPPAAPDVATSIAQFFADLAAAFASADALATGAALFAMVFAHCPLMCGPLAAAVPHPLAYFAGRSAGYAALCAAAFAASAAIAPGPAARAALLFFAGCFLLVLAAALAFRGPLLAAIESRRIAAFIGRIALCAFRSRRGSVIFAAGLLNAALPCGLVYFALARAAVAANFASAMAAAIMLAALSNAALAASRALLRAVSGGFLGNSPRSFLRFLAPVLIAAQGGYLAFSGLVNG